MLDAREVGIAAERELRRNLRSTKGIVMMVLFFLGGLVPSVVNLMIQRAITGAGLNDIPEEARRQTIERALANLYQDEATGKYLVQAPLTLFGLLQGTIRFLPLFVLLIGFDQIAGEVQYRTLRYSAVRADRSSLVVGKALGMYAVIAAMTLLLHVTVWVLLIATGTHVGSVLSWGMRFWCFSVVSAGAYVGFTSLMSSLFRTPVVSLFVGVGAGFALWLTYTIANYVEKIAFLRWGFPNAYEMLLVSPNPGKVLGGIGLLLAWGAVCVAGSSWIVCKRDV